jgi:hypothetical protein
MEHGLIQSGDLSAEGGDEASLVYARLPRPLTRIPVRFLWLVPLVFLIIAALLLWNRLYSIAAMIPVMLFLAMFLATVWYITARQAKRRARMEKENLNPIERVFFEQDRDTPIIVRRFGQLWSWEEISTRLDAAGIERPHAIVDVALEPRLRDIERPAHMLEPETILPSSNLTMPMTVGFITLYAALATLQLAAGHFWTGLTMLGMGAFFVVMIPAVRDRLRNFHPQEGRVVAGQGWVSDRNERTWTVADSVMVVSAGANDQPPIQVTFTGPAGVMTLTYINEGDPDFVKLWQRWNHPDPRPGLAGQV